MQRVNRLRLGATRRRLSGERGATAVVVALLLVPLLGFGAIAVDVGALYAEKSRLQTAADAAALAVAADCAYGDCGDMLATAQQMVSANVGSADAAHPVLTENPDTVTVTGGTPMDHWFAPVLGHDSTQLSTSATVAWGAPDRGIAVLPLTFSWCEFSQQTNGGDFSGSQPYTIYFTKTSRTQGCTGPSENIVPGGFAYLDTPEGECEAASARNEKSFSKTGNVAPSTCSPIDFSEWLGQTVLLPLFIESGATGTNAWYKVYGYAAFHITGYHLGAHFSTSPQPCRGNERCVRGYFTEFVELSSAFDFSADAPPLGALVLQLIR